jgi:hypothetical protein
MELSLFLIPILNRRPEVEVVEPELVWIRAGTTPSTLAATAGINFRFADFSKFPPDRSPHYGTPLPVEGSLLGVVADDWQSGVAKLRSIIGAYCSALPDWEVSHKAAAPPPSGIASIGSDGGLSVRYGAPIAPQLVRAPHVMGARFADVLVRLVNPGLQGSQAIRHRTALSFISLGWLLDDTVAFINYFIALDAMFGQGKGKTEPASWLASASTSRTRGGRPKLERANLR